MTEEDAFWDFYWEMRLQELQEQGKREAIYSASRLLRQLENQPGKAVRLLELGCGEGQIIGVLVEAHADVRGIRQSVGVDYSHESIEKCRRAFPSMRFIEDDFSDPALLKNLGQFEMVLLVNALHEVFSAAYREDLGEVDSAAGKQAVVDTLAQATDRLSPGGYLLLFDGLEPPGDPLQRVEIRFRSPRAQQLFYLFAAEYHSFKITFKLTRPDSVTLSLRDFVRYITKMIFLGKPRWELERFESYQYFSQAEFLAAFAGLNLPVKEMRTLTVDEEKWRSEVDILTPGVVFPEEHILIVAQKE